MNQIDRTSSHAADGNSVSLRLILHCTKSETQKLLEITFPSLPCTIKDLKSTIETKCHIPECTQSLMYEMHPLINENDLKAARLRSGDAITVFYLSEGDCEEIVKVLSWMGLILASLKQKGGLCYGCEINQELNRLLIYGIECEHIENLAFDYFYPWLDARKYVNKLHFLHNGGLEIMMEIYSHLLKKTWSQCLLKVKYLEYGILRVLWNFSETFALRRAIIHLGGLDMCMTSLLREPVMRGEAIVDRQSPRGTNQDWILVENIGAALGTLCNLSELPEIHLEIATRGAVVEQMTCISLSPSVQIMSSLLVATVFLCLAATPETHQYISTPLVIGRLIEACGQERDLRRGSDKEIDRILLRYFTLMFFAQVALVSPHCIPSTLHTPIKHLMSDFLKTAEPEQIREGEVKHWYVWQTFMPYVKLAYLPTTTTTHSRRPLLLDGSTSLQTLSLELIVLSLQNMLGRSNHREVLLLEGLLDYVVCLPWFVPEAVRPRAQELVNTLTNCSDVSVDPPQLLSISKAVIAQTQTRLGLKEVMELPVGEITKTLLLLPF